MELVILIYKDMDDDNSINVTNFKANCIAILKGINKKRVPLTVTSRGVPLVTIYPSEKTPGRTFGAQPSSVQVIDDIVETDFSDDWESLESGSQ